MGHLPKLIVDLTLILIAAAVTTLLFRKIKQPLVLGYIIAGFLVGPHFMLTPTVADTDNIKTLAEIGVIFLLFGLGLEFSFKKLMRVGGAASITALVEIIFITVAGYFLGRWMKWSTMDSLFLGGMLASSSTTIIVKAFDELGIKAKQYARIVFGVLIVEDIVVILLMVLLSTIAITQQIEGSEMVLTVLKLLFFLALWFIGGIFLLPSLIKSARNFLDEETLLILSTGLCLGMVVLAVYSGFSAELGAFIMGSILAETTSAEKVEHILKPVKDLFGAVFFVSVGMMIDPQTIIEYRMPVLWITLLTVFGKFFSTGLGAILSGQPLKQSVKVGMSMAQIGEFAFIVAALGLSLGVTSDFLFPVAVGASAITTFTTPYMIRYSEPFYNWMVKKLPKKWVKSLNSYTTSTQTIQAESTWKITLKEYAMLVITNGIIVLGIILLVFNVGIPFFNRNFQNRFTAQILSLVLALGLSAPFLWALMAKRPENIAYKELWIYKRYSRGPLLVLEIIRNILGILIVAFIVNRIFNTLIAMLLIVPLVIVVMVVFSKRIQQFYQRLEGRFLSNLNERELAEQRMKHETNALTKQFYPASDLSPWDADIIDLEVSPYAEYVGKTLEELTWREQFGINIAYIKRGEKLIYAPGRNNKLLPFDRVGVIATDEQMKSFKPEFDKQENILDINHYFEDVIVQKIIVNEVNQLRGKSIRDSAIRERTNGLVVGIERQNERILNPDSSTIFQWNDIVWIVGERKKIQRLSGSKSFS